MDMTPLITVPLVLVVVGALAYRIFRAEIRKETMRTPRKLGNHDSTYGKDVAVTGAAHNAAVFGVTESGR
jgi:hypothetical protein